MPDTTAALPWDSARWTQLGTRAGPGGERVRDLLRRLSDDPSQVELFAEFWPEMCSEGTTYEVAYAAAPFIVDFAARTPTPTSSEYLIVLGLIATEAGEAPSDLRPAYSDALAKGLVLALERLPDCPTDHTLRYLLVAVAALRGRVDLASVLQDLDAASGQCQVCGADVFPHELQGVIRRDGEEESAAST